MDVTWSLLQFGRAVTYDSPPPQQKKVVNGYDIKIRMSTPITDSIVPTKHIS